MGGVTVRNLTPQDRGSTESMSRRLLFSIPSYEYLEPAFLAAGDFEQGKTERKYFPDGERYLRIESDLWGRDVVVLGGTPTDVDWLEVFDLASGIARGGARSLAIVIPYFGYQTMERAVRPGEVVVAKTRARLLSSIPAPEGGTRFFLFDLHTDGIEFYLDDRVLTRHIYGAPIVTQEDPGAHGRHAVRARRVRRGAREVGAEPRGAISASSRRSSTSVATRRSGGLAVTGVNADVKGKEVVIYDDMIRTGSLAHPGREVLPQRGRDEGARDREPSRSARRRARDRCARRARSPRSWAPTRIRAACSSRRKTSCRSRRASSSA